MTFLLTIDVTNFTANWGPLYWWVIIGYLQLSRSYMILMYFVISPLKQFDFTKWEISLIKSWSCIVAGFHMRWFQINEITLLLSSLHHWVYCNCAASHCGYFIVSATLELLSSTIFWHALPTYNAVNSIDNVSIHDFSTLMLYTIK